MLKPDFIERKISFITRDLERLSEFDHLTFAEAAEDWHTYTLIERLLEQIITRAIDINRHLIAELGTGRERTYKHEETFLELANLCVIDQALAKKIAPSAGLRNRLVHDYNDTDQKIIVNSMKDALRQYTRYCDAILKFLQTNR